MKKILLSGFVSGLLLSCAINSQRAAFGLEKTNSGDYVFTWERGAGIYLWEVVDPDPAGLNCRLHPSYEPWIFDSIDGPNLSEPPFSGGYIDVAKSWPIFVSLKKGTQLQANVGQVWPTQLHMRDHNNKPWLLMRVEGKQCFVRAHESLIRPISEPGQLPGSE